MHFPGPKLSVIMANYNHAHYLERALDAILTQSYRPFELVIVDDGSTDNSVEIIRRFAAQDPVVKLLQNDRNRGVLYSSNRAFEASSGEYLYSAAADDIVYPGFFAQSIDLLVRHPQAGLCSGLTMLMDETGRSLGFQPSPIVSRGPAYFPPDEVQKMLMRYGAWFIGNATILKRQALIDAGGYDPELQAYTDSFAYHAVATRYGACFIPAYFGSWRKTTTQYSTLQFSDLNKHQTMVRKMADALGALEEQGLLPKKYKVQWEKRQLYWSGIAHQNILKQAQKKVLDFLEEALPGWHRPLVFTLSLLFALVDLLIQSTLLWKSFTFPSHPLMLHSMLFHKKMAKKMDASHKAGLSRR